MPRRVLLSWSSGKDAAYALHRLRADSELEVVGLLTTHNGAFDRVAMHGERGEFHIFAWDGPMYRQPVAIAPGETVIREGFVYADRVPA
ncbi:MAG: hypothetical protein KGI56_01775 [Acidobacteriota bacterium]|nr:hypothetical protein [Acidobacteriota bacterium]